MGDIHLVRAIMLIPRWKIDADGEFSISSRLVLNDVIRGTGLGIRAVKAIQRLKVERFSELAEHYEFEISSLRNVGDTTIRELRHALAVRGLSFKSTQ